MSSISVVIPVYRSRETLVVLHRRLVEVLEHHAPEFEIILVEDCGGDGSWDVIRQLAAADPRVRGVQLGRNYGQHNALLCGIRLARFELVVTLDDDLQTPPEEIPKLLARLSEGFDVVYGTPNQEQHGLLRNAASRITKMVLQRAMGAETAGRVSAFRVFRSRVSTPFSQFRGPFVSVDVLLTWGTSRFAHAVVRHDPRSVGKSNYTVGKLLSHAINMMTGFSTMPLQIASVVGFLFTVFGLLILSYVVGRYLIDGTTMPGFPFLASIIAIFSGAQLFAIGIIGEYLARMHFHTMERPSYVVIEETRPSPAMPPRSSPSSLALPPLSPGS